MSDTHISPLPKTVRAGIVKVPVNERRRGAVSSYDPQLVMELAELVAAGWTDRELASHFGIAVTTLYSWKTKHADFARAMEMNDKHAVERMKGSLYTQGLGYSYIEQQAIKVKTGEHTEAVEIVEVVKHVPANPGSAIFYLKNRDRENWRDQQDVNVSGTVEMKTDLRELALAMLATIKAATLDEQPKTIEGITSETPTE